MCRISWESITLFPLGVAIALALPKKKWAASLSLVALGFPLLIPYNIVGIIWRIFTRADLGLAPLLLAHLDMTITLR